MSRESVEIDRIFQEINDTKINDEAETRDNPRVTNFDRYDPRA